MRVRIRLAMLVLALGALVAPAGAAPPVPTAGMSWGAAWSPDGETIAFVGHGGSLWRMNADGSAKERIVATGVLPFTVRWSPDGSALVFDAFDTASQAMDVEVAPLGGAPRRVADLAAFDSAPPAWSPDGRRVAYATGNAVHTVRPDGADNTVVAANVAGRVLDVAWAPGPRIAYSSDVTGVSIVGSAAPRQIVALSALAPGGHVAVFHLGWSPDGARLLLDVGAEPHSEQQVWTVAADGSALTRVAAIWSNDRSSWNGSNAILFTGAPIQNGRIDIYQAALDGTTTRLVDDSAVERAPVASPTDPTKIAFTVNYGPGENSTDVFELDTAAHTRRNLTGTASGESVTSESLGRTNRLVIGSVTGVGRTLNVAISDTRHDDVVGVLVSARSLTRGVSVGPARRTDSHGQAFLALSAPRSAALAPGRRLTVVVTVRAHRQTVKRRTTVVMSVG